MTLAGLRRAVEGACNALALAGGGVLLALTAYTVADVTMRALFNDPLPGAVDVVSYGLGLTVALVLPLGFARDHHVAVDLLSAALPVRARAAMMTLVTLISAAFIGILGWRAILYAAERAAVGDRMWILQYPVWPVWAVIAAMFCVTALVLLALTVLRGAEAARGKVATP